MPSWIVSLTLAFISFAIIRHVGMQSGGHQMEQITRNQHPQFHFCNARCARMVIIIFTGAFYSSRQGMIDTTPRSIHQIMLERVARASVINLHSNPQCTEGTKGNATDLIVPTPLKKWSKPQVNFWKCALMRFKSECSVITRLLQLSFFFFLSSRRSPLDSSASSVCVEGACLLVSASVFSQQRYLCLVSASVRCNR